MQLLPLSDGNDIPTIFSSAFRCATTELTREEVVHKFRAGVRHWEIAELFGNGHIICATLDELTSRRGVHHPQDLAQSAHSRGYGGHSAGTVEGHGLELRGYAHGARTD